LQQFVVKGIPLFEVSGSDATVVYFITKIKNKGLAELRWDNKRQKLLQLKLSYYPNVFSQ
jgi:hypothetical protein